MPSQQVRQALLLAALALGGGAVLTACGSTTGTTTGNSAADALYFTTTSLPVGYVAEAYSAPVVVAGGAGPYGLRLASGTLPPGVTLQGNQLSGRPTKTGAYTFILEASDAGLRTKVQSYTVNVNDLPPLALNLTLPTGEIRGETRIPVTIAGPRTVRAARLVWTLPQGVQVTRLQPGDLGSVLFWRQEGQTLSVSVGFKTIPRAGARVMLVSVKPSGPVTLTNTGLNYEARDGEGKLLTQKLVPTPSAPAPASVPAPGTGSAAGNTGSSTAGTPASGTPSGTATPSGSGSTEPAPGGKP